MYHSAMDEQAGRHVDEPIALRAFGEGPVLVLVHGDFNTGMMAWRRQAQEPGGRTLLIPDRRGYGDSPPLRSRHSIAGDARDVLAAVTASGVGTFDLAGHSYGGLVAIEMARTSPDRVRSLVLVEPPMLALLPDHPAVARLREQTAALWAAAPHLADDALAESFFGVLAGPADLARMKESRGWPDLVREARRALSGQSPAEYPATALADLAPALPVAVLAGGKSHPGLRAIAEEIVRRHPGAAFVVAPDQGHAAQFDREAFAAALVAAAAPAARPAATATAKAPVDGTAGQRHRR